MVDDAASIGIAKQPIGWAELTGALYGEQWRIVRCYKKSVSSYTLRSAASSGRLRGLAILLGHFDQTRFLELAFARPMEWPTAIHDKATEVEMTALFVAACVNAQASPFSPRQQTLRAMRALSWVVASRFALNS